MNAGDIISGKYQLNRILGSGGMADVWSATNTFTEREFAVKFMHEGVAKTKEATDRFLQEAKVSARINHPNVIEIFDVGQTDDGKLFLVMELLSGVSLETALRRQNPPMTLTELSFVMVEVARALAAAHECGVIHRDLKPSNIYLHKDRSGNPVPKVLDFGVSKFLESERGRVHALTVQGTVLGSPLYMSPEQARGESRVDGRSDIFSFGAILFEALCGFRAYDGGNFNALIVQIATGAPKDINVCAPHVPESLREVVRDCLETDRAKRPADFSVVAARMMAMLPDLEAQNVHVPAPNSSMMLHDPDATHALPVIRASDRPPEFAPSYGSVPPASHTPESTALTSTAIRPPQPFRVQPQWVMAGGLVFFGLVVLISLFAFKNDGRNTTRQETVPSLSGGGAPAAPPPTSTELQQGVRIDTLPQAKNRGQLSVVSNGDPCVVSVDGARVGKMPIGPLQLTPGAHQLDCVTASGVTRSTKLTVQAGASSTYTFNVK
jgi:eukaryotic-like serine/threonine-protein kinase